jgi:hypothetical protein
MPRFGCFCPACKADIVPPYFIACPKCGVRSQIANEEQGGFELVPEFNEVQFLRYVHAQVKAGGPRLTIMEVAHNYWAETGQIVPPDFYT